MVNVIGLGYIGLPTALMLASHGTEVVGTDYNKQLVENLKIGKVTFKEKGLASLFDDALLVGIGFSTEYQSTDTYIISVPTPYDKWTKKVDASYVVAAVREVLDVCKTETVIVIESTVSPGTIDANIRPMVKDAELRQGKKVHLVHAPERIIPGNMVYELQSNNRTIGADSLEVAKKVQKLYSTFCQGEMVLTDIRTAEMTKVVENSFRAANIAFANELSRICRHDNMDVYEIIRICNMHPRVNIMNPGPGVGGHCISVDPWFLVGDYPELAKMLSESLRVNESQPDFVLSRMREIMDEKQFKDTQRIGLYGLTYKENVDDFRDSPTLQLLDSLKRHLARPLKCYDPFLEKNQIVETQYDNFKDFLDDVDMVVIMVKHDHITQHWNRLADKVILDCHHICPLSNTYYL